MASIYQPSRKEFIAHWEQLRKEYQNLGMSPSVIEALYQFDLAEYNANRAELRHRVELPHSPANDRDNGQSAESPLLLRNLEKLSAPYNPFGYHDRYLWLEELSSPRLTHAIPKLTQEDKELLTLYFKEKYTMEEIAEQMGVSKVAISYRLATLRKLFAKTP